jgi:hypothetical protein
VVMGIVVHRFLRIQWGKTISLLYYVLLFKSYE